MNILEQYKRINNWSTKYIYIHVSFLALVGLRIYALATHEMWRAEAQLPLIVRDSASFGQMYMWQSYGREHILWPFLLKVIAMGGLNPIDVSLWVNIICSIGLLAIIIYGIPRLNLIVKLLIGASYFLLYEYTALTRVYGLSAFLFGVFVFLEVRSQKYYILKMVVLFLLALSSNLGLGLAIATLVYSIANGSRNLTIKGLAGPAIVLFGIAISIITALPPQDISEAAWLNNFRATALSYFGLPRIIISAFRMTLDGFLYIPQFSSQQWYEPPNLTSAQSLLSRGVNSNIVLQYLIGISIIALALLFLWRLYKTNKPLSLGMATLWGGNLIVWATMHPGYVRHFGLLVLGTFGFLFLVKIKYPNFYNKGIKATLLTILLVSSASGLWSVFQEGKESFSQSSNLAAWWATNASDKTPYVYPDHIGASLSLYSGKQAYTLFANDKIPNSFVKEKQGYQHDFSVSALSEKAEHIKDELLITSFPLHVKMDGGKTIIQPVKAFQPSIARHESFWVHRILSGVQDEPWTLKYFAFEGDYWYVNTSLNDGNGDILNLPDDRLNNKIGTTIEFKARFINTPEYDSSAFVVQVIDGTRPLKISFFSNRFEIQEDVLATLYSLDTTKLHTYRFTLHGNEVRVYVDGHEVGRSIITAQGSGKGVFLTTNPNSKDKVSVVIEYLAYSIDGVLLPDGILPDGVSAWSGFIDMSLLPDTKDAPEAMWKQEGVYSVKFVKEGILQLVTHDEEMGYFVKHLPEINNILGTTAEIKLKTINGTDTGSNGISFSLADGLREATITIFSDYINVLDGDTFQKLHWMNTSDDFHVYRVAMIGGTMRLYVDGKEIFSSILTNPNGNRRIRFGDFSGQDKQNVISEVDYVAYKLGVALTPEGIIAKQVEITDKSSTVNWTGIKGGFTVHTTGNQTDPTGSGYPISAFNNIKGSTVELMMKILEAPSSGFNGAILSLIDGQREAKISFFTDRIELRDQNDIKATCALNTTSEFILYRITILRDEVKVFVNSQLVAESKLTNVNTKKTILFGDLSKAENENMHALISYLAYSVEEALAPN